MDCLFCKIVNRTLKSTILYEDSEVLALDDVHAQAPCHKLVIPKVHIATLNALTSDHNYLLGHMIVVAQQLAHDLAIADEGYRLVFNCNKQGGQEVYHIHLHLLGGRQMHWPPG